MGHKRRDLLRPEKTRFVDDVTVTVDVNFQILHQFVGQELFLLRIENFHFCL
jgi:hypothetical protein